jgi:pimeloyl-ACP methyl ester carboxylesterase
MPYLNIGGCQYYYYMSKCSFPPAQNQLVFIHGSGGNHKFWSKQINALSSNTQLIIPDLPGHGLSEDRGRDTIRDYVEWLKEFFTALNLKKSILIGHSMGGAIAQEFALHYPGCLRALVLVGTGAKLRVSPAILSLVNKDFEMMVHVSCEYAYSETVPEEIVREGFEILCQNPPEILYGDFLACDRFDSREKLHEIFLPTLIICGSGDKLTPPFYSQYLHESICNSVLHIIEGGGHMIMVERPSEVNDLIEKFCQSLS